MLPPIKRTSSPLRKMNRPDAGKGWGKAYFYLGLALLAAFALQEANNWRWSWLAEMQGNNLYRQLSGFALVTYLAQQWHCSVLRNRGIMRKAGRILKRHKVFGSLAPVFFYTHSQSLGYAYLQVLSLAYFAIFLTGLFNFEITRIHKPWFQTIWITVHIGPAMGLLLLLGYHIFISYAYT